MKNRIGFISNSSSTSFIVDEEEKEKMIKESYHEIKFFRVSDMIEKMREILDKIPRPYEDNEFFPTFVFDDNGIYYTLEHTINGLQKIEEKRPGCYITSPYDRDYAYEHQWNFEEYAVDL